MSDRATDVFILSLVHGPRIVAGLLGAAAVCLGVVVWLDRLEKRP